MKKKTTTSKRTPAGDRSAEWTFLTNHSHVLLCLVADPDATLREVAGQIGITERAVQMIVADLVDAGILIREREGRRNHYSVDPGQPLRHPVEAHRRVRDLIRMVHGPRRRSQ